MATHPTLCAALCLAALLSVPACSVNNAGPGETDDEGGQLITRETIRQSGLSTGWEVLRRYADYLSIGEHERGPVRVTRRGRESLYLTESPLLIVDGVKVSNFRVLTTLPARDIESMRILSASEGTLAHGMHAASGVIIVRTVHPDPYVARDTSALRRVGVQKRVGR